MEMLDAYKNKFIDKRILVIIAHPDDETLYFYSGLKWLSKIANLKVLCATYLSNSIRGKELLSICESLNIRCDFLEIEDLGFNKMLIDLDQKLIHYFKKNTFDLIISHPPHGGEKPHPHHMQIFLSSLSYSLQYGMSFGFFSEVDIIENVGIDLIKTFQLSFFKLWKFYSIKVLKINLLHKIKWILYVYNKIFNIYISNYFRPYVFSKYRLECDTQEKKLFLNKYVSQIEVLDYYKSKDSINEFLFLTNSLGRIVL